MLSRRQFIKSSLVLGAGVLETGTIGTSTILGTPVGLFKASRQKPDSEIQGVQISTITYSYRSMRDQSVEGLLKDIVKDGINAVELIGEPAERFAGKPKNPKQVAEWRASVSMDKFAQLGRMYNDAGVHIYAWKPKVFGKNNSDAEINYGFRVAKAMGATACTTEHPHPGPKGDAQTKRLGDIAAKHKIYIAYHAHAKTTRYTTKATPYLWNTALEQSKWNAINLDVGHWVAAGNPSPIPFIKANHYRIESLHLKDRTTPADGALNLPWGEGDTPITKVLQLMRGQHYGFPAAIELEYKIPKGSNAVKEVAKCLTYCRNALER
jgi:sugar phosphate isomerase/epimerase